MGSGLARPDVQRLVVGGVLCLCCLGLVVGFGHVFEGSSAYPDAVAIDANYDDRVGDRVHLWGVVAGEEAGRVVVRVGPLRLRVSEPPPSAVAPGDGIQIYGRLDPGERFETTAYHVQSSGRVVYMYGVSVVGGLVAAGAFLRRWRIDRERWAFVPREDR